MLVKAKFSRQARILKACIVYVGIPLLSVGAAVAAPIPMRFILLPVETVLQKDTVLGPKKAGLLCMPNGKVRWRDISPDDAALTDLVARHLRAAGLKVSSSLETDNVDGTTPLKVTVTDFKVAACARRWGFGDRGTMTGQGTVSMSWSQRGKSNDDLKGLTFETVETFQVDPKQDPNATILSEAIKSSVEAAASHLKAQ